MGKTVEQCCGHPGVAEHGSPVAEAEAGGDVDAGGFAKLARKMEGPRAARGDEWQVSPLVQVDEDQKIDPRDRFPEEGKSRRLRLSAICPALPLPLPLACPFPVPAH